MELEFSGGIMYLSEFILHSVFEQIDRDTCVFELRPDIAPIDPQYAYICLEVRNETPMSAILKALKREDIDSDAPEIIIKTDFTDKELKIIREAVTIYATH